MYIPSEANRSQRSIAHVRAVTRTAMTRGNWSNPAVDAQMKATTPWGDWGIPAEVAKSAVFLASDDAAWVTGVGLPVDGGYLAQ